MISGFRREVVENCDILGYYTAYSGNTLPTSRDNLSVPSLKNQESKKRREFSCILYPRRWYRWLVPKRR